jgi:hypothetical protein
MAKEHEHHMGHEKKEHGMGGKHKESHGQPGLGKKMAGFSSKVGKNHKHFGKEMSPAGK